MPNDPSAYLIIALVIIVGVAVIDLIAAIEPFDWDDSDDNTPHIH